MVRKDKDQLIHIEYESQVVKIMNGNIIGK